VLASAKPEPRLDEIRMLARERSIEVEEADRQRLDDITHTDSHQGVIAYGRPPALLGVERPAR